MLLLVAVGLLGAACGGGSSSRTASTPTTTAGSAATVAGAGAGRTSFVSCLESHGVPASAAGSFGFGRRGQSGSSPPPSSDTGTRPTIPSQYQSAFSACRSQLPGGGAGRGGFNTAAFAAYRNCLQVHGVTLPTSPSTTPGSSGAGGAPPSGGGLAGLQSNPAYQAAAQACASLRPGRTGATTSTTTAG